MFRGPTSAMAVLVLFLVLVPCFAIFKYERFDRSFAHSKSVDLKKMARARRLDPNGDPFLYSENLIRSVHAGEKHFEVIEEFGHSERSGRISIVRECYLFICNTRAIRIQIESVVQILFDEQRRDSSFSCGRFSKFLESLQLGE
jgi:hypothetical protein